jgi:hypothetical protein
LPMLHLRWFSPTRRKPRNFSGNISCAIGAIDRSVQRTYPFQRYHLAGSCRSFRSPGQRSLGEIAQLMGVRAFPDQRCSLPAMAGPQRVYTLRHFAKRDPRQLGFHLVPLANTSRLSPCCALASLRSRE